MVTNGIASASGAETPYEGVDEQEWQTMVERGSAVGVLHADDIAHVLRKVELTGDEREAHGHRHEQERRAHAERVGHRRDRGRRPPGRCAGEICRATSSIAGG